MVDNVLDWAGVKSAQHVLDVGCGIGGSTRHIARRFGCKGTGITLSPVQVGIANDRTQRAGLQGVSFQVADAHRIGLLATDLEPVFPKSVTYTELDGFGRVRLVDTQQLEMAHIGATQALLARVSTLAATVEELAARC